MKSGPFTGSHRPMRSDEIWTSYLILGTGQKARDSVINVHLSYYSIKHSGVSINYKIGITDAFRVHMIMSFWVINNQKKVKFLNEPKQV